MALSSSLLSAALKGRLAAADSLKDAADAEARSAEAVLEKHKLDFQEAMAKMKKRAKEAEARCKEVRLQQEPPLSSQQQQQQQQQQQLDHLIQPEHPEHLLLELQNARKLIATLQGVRGGAEREHVVKEVPAVPALDFKKVAPSSSLPRNTADPAKEAKENGRLRMDRDTIRREYELVRLENAQLKEDLRRERHAGEEKIAAAHIETERTVRECRQNQKAALKAAAWAEAQMKRDGAEWEAERRKLLRQVDTCRMWTMQSQTEGRVMAKLEGKIMMQHGYPHGAGAGVA